MTTLKPRTASVVIYQGDDMDRMTELRRAAEQAEAIAERSKGAPRRAGDEFGAGVQEAKDAYDAFVDEAAERAVTVELHSIGRRRFRDLMTEHPPRKVMVKDDPDPEQPDLPVKEHEEDHPEDAGYDVNVDTFPEALLTYIDPDDSEVRTIAAPEFKDRKAVTAFLDDSVSEGDFNGLWQAAYYLNRMPSQDPKASRFSAAPRSSTVT